MVQGFHGALCSRATTPQVPMSGDILDVIIGGATLPLVGG